ncbi:MAG: LpxA family transferase [Cyclobacteriaceae bacterium]
MLNIDPFIKNFPVNIVFLRGKAPWEISSSLKDILEHIIPSLDKDFNIKEGIAIHKSAIVEPGVTFKRPVVVMENSFIGAHAYFREGVFLDKSVKIGPGCEIKSSLICSNTAIAHFNYIGNSIIGHHVNFEAGSIAANHYNERPSKKIKVRCKDKIIDTQVEKFGSLVGDHSKIGANAVLSPGTILEPHSIVKRLELIEQIKEK